ncbi:MAG TPA: creatininase family protein, partial [Gemmatimonadales bacterium]|nr:creatininase family protein [Gemmatimonadales bacterium]
MTHSGPWRLKEMLPAEVRERLARRPTLLVPVGTTEQHGPHLPLGADTIIVERLTDDLSARLGVVRAPTLEYGVNAFDAPVFPGSATLKRKTLHRLMNELIDSWETGAGVRDFLVLTAQGHEPHQEALATIRVNEARLRVVDVFAMDFGDLLSYPDGPVHGGELDTSLLLHLAPDLVRLESPPEAPEAVAARGRRGRRA